MDNETDLLVYFRNNIEVLCEAVSIQIVHQCKNYVNLQVILEGDTENGINILRKCISSCQIYKTIYNKVSKLNIWPILPSFHQAKYS